METQQFDRLVKRLSARLSRRTALRGGSAGVAALGAAVARRASAQTATPATSPGTPVAGASPSGTTAHPDALDNDQREYLFTQSFEGGTWQPKAGSPDTYTLTLNEAASDTVYFTDRPERIVGLTPMQQFLDVLGFTPANPPNAALVAAPQGGGDQDVLVIELFNPRYDAGAHTLTYDAKILKDYEGTGIASLAVQQTDNDFAEQFGPGGLFIDDYRCSDGCGNCHLYSTGELIGKICNVSCCKHWPGCDHCVGNGKTAYYGTLCNETFPGPCPVTHNNGTTVFACYASDIHCGGGIGTHCNQCP